MTAATASAILLRRERDADGIGQPGGVPTRVALTTSVTPLTAEAGMLAPAWDELAEAAGEPNVFAERWFVMAGIRHLSEPGAVRVIAVWEECAPRRLIALLPVHISGFYGRLPLRHVTNWLHHHSFLGTPLIRTGYERAGWRAILGVLDDADWACGLLHLNGLSADDNIHRGLIAAAAELGRPCDTVHRIERAMLASDLSPEAYYEQTVRKKKRKELKRLSARLEECGVVEMRRLAPEDDVGEWIAAFLALEASGWKGAAGSALGSTAHTRGFFRDAIAGAHGAGRLEIVRLDLDGRPIAMLVNLLRPPGAFSFKIAFDEDYARYSPGVLLQLENLRILANPEIAWMDSCAVEHHPMINSLWAERRAIVRVSVPLGGRYRAAQFRLARLVETSNAALKRITRRGAQAPRAGDPEHD